MNLRLGVFIALNDNYGRVVIERNHYIKAFDLSSNQIIKFTVIKLQNVQNDARDAGFAMTSRNYNPLFVEALFINIFGKRINLDA